MTTPTELRRALGKLGIWMHPRAAPGLDPVEFGRKIEDAGFRAVWVPGVDDATALDALEPILAATTRLVVATGIANIWTWEPADLAARTDQLAGSYPGRFILGLGNSHAPRVEQAGQVYAKPYSKMASFLDELPATRAPIVLAALGPKMLGLSRDRALGAYPYFNPPEHVIRRPGRGRQPAAPRCDRPAWPGQVRRAHPPAPGLRRGPRGRPSGRRRRQVRARQPRRDDGTSQRPEGLVNDRDAVWRGVVPDLAPGGRVGGMISTLAPGPMAPWASVSSAGSLPGAFCTKNCQDGRPASFSAREVYAQLALARAACPAQSMPVGSCRLRGVCRLRAGFGMMTMRSPRTSAG